jgi:hypothetical protein
MPGYKQTITCLHFWGKAATMDSGCKAVLDQLGKKPTMSTER